MASLSPTALPGLLVELHRQGFEGWVRLDHGGSKRHYQWQGGSPLRLDSNDDRDALVEWLISRGAVDETARTTFARERARKPGPELACLVSLKLAPPKVLLAALADQLRGTLLDTMGWERGSVELEPEDAAGPDLAHAPIDVLTVAAEGVARNWRPDQVLQVLGAEATRCPVPAPGFDELRPRLPATPAVEQLCAALEGSESAFNLLRRLADPSAYGALWLLHAVGALEWRAAGAKQTDAGAAAAQVAVAEEPELEILVVGAADAAGAGSEPGPASDAKAAAVDAKAEKLREEIAALHVQLESADYWQLLGVERDATPPQIKKAYLKKAKRLHPDKVSRLGIEDLKVQANELFAVIARAHEVLTDPDERRAYEAQLEGHTSVDADSLAQAEMLFMKGEILMKAGKFLEAHELLEAVVELWPGEADYQAALAWTLFKKSPPEDERSVEHFEKALSLNAEQAVVPLRFSFVLKAVGQAERAEQEAERARALDPDVRV